MCAYRLIFVSQTLGCVNSSSFKEKTVVFFGGVQNEINSAPGIVLKRCFSVGLFNEQPLPIKGRVDPLFTFYKGNLGLIK